MMDPRAQYERLAALVNDALDGCLRENCAQAELLEAMRYSLLSGGKRIRPVLLLAFCEMSGGDVNSALGAACGIEMLHTYSLIHDDLPCMDDDDLRRGRPTCHRVYGETNAVLAGDALQAEAFSQVLRSSCPGERLAAMAGTLADAAGPRGMCGGQYLDTSARAPVRDEADLYRIHSLKTGALLRAACVMGVQCAGGTQEQLRAAEQYAGHLGMAFQIRDDVLDEISSTEVLGKPVGSDAEEGKVTYASLLGVAECARRVETHTAQAVEALGGAFADASFAVWLAKELARREK